jgi:hypothetical protein
MLRIFTKMCRMDNAAPRALAPRIVDQQSAVPIFLFHKDPSHRILRTGRVAAAVGFLLVVLHLVNALALGDPYYQLDADQERNMFTVASTGAVVGSTTARERSEVRQ